MQHVMLGFIISLYLISYSVNEAIEINEKKEQEQQREQERKTYNK